jgi:hypothetical protein
MALDSAHQQLFTAWPALDRVDVLSTSDYHMIHSIAVPSPSTLDISPDGTTLAVGTSASHIFFFNTATFAKTNDIVFPGDDPRCGGVVYGRRNHCLLELDIECLSKCFECRKPNEVDL